MALSRLTAYIAKNPPNAVRKWLINYLYLFLQSQEGKSEPAVETKTKGGKSKKDKKNSQASGNNRDSDETSPNEHNGKTVRIIWFI